MSEKSLSVSGRVLIQDTARLLSDVTDPDSSPGQHRALIRAKNTYGWFGEHSPGVVITLAAPPSLCGVGRDSVWAEAELIAGPIGKMPLRVRSAAGLGPGGGFSAQRRPAQAGVVPTFIAEGHLIGAQCL